MVGVILAIIAIGLIFKGIPGFLAPLLKEVIIVIKGALPIALLLLGLFIAWLYYDEWKIEKEFKKEEERIKAEEEKRKRKKKG